MSDIDAQLIWESYKSKIINERSRSHYAEMVNAADFEEYRVLDLEATSDGYGGITFADRSAGGIRQYNALQIAALKDYIRRLHQTHGLPEDELNDFANAALMTPKTHEILRKHIAHHNPELFDYITKDDPDSY